MKRTTLRMILLTVLILMIAPSVILQAGQKPLRLAYVEWSSEIASANLVRAVLVEKMGVDCEIIPMEADKMWMSVAEGTADAMVAAWLPKTHGHYFREVAGRVENLGPNLEGAKIGLVVPHFSVGRQTLGTGLRNKAYIRAQSIGELKTYANKFHGKIIGIDPEAGVMKRADEAIRAYDLSGFRLIPGSEISMTAELSNAIRKQRWIVVTGWSPHWMFGRWDMRFLEDPKNVFGGEEHIATIVRKGLKADMPKVYAFLDKFYWTPEEMDQMMVWIKDDEGMYPYEKAIRWLRFNKERVSSWTE